MLVLILGTLSLISKNDHILLNNNLKGEKTYVNRSLDHHRIICRSCPGMER